MNGDIIEITYSAHPTGGKRSKDVPVVETKELVISFKDEDSDEPQVAPTAGIAGNVNAYMQLKSYRILIHSCASISMIALFLGLYPPSYCC